MPSDDYASASGGALKLKGAKVKKHKKKKDKSGDLERALAATGGESSETALSKREGDDARPEEGKREGEGRSDEEEDSGPIMTKTEAQRKFEEARKKKLREIAETAHSRPELLKTHKDRVEELNVYLSKLSEHHDMPKIGPG